MPKARDEKTRDLSEIQRFSIFVSGLSNGWVTVDPLAKGKADQPIIRRKTLQLNFKRAGDRFSIDSREITFEPPAEWIYRSSRLAEVGTTAVRSPASCPASRRSQRWRRRQNRGQGRPCPIWI